MRTELYELPWYMLKSRHRKILAFNLMRAQNPPMITFGGFAPVNIAAFLQVKKKSKFFTEIFLMLV